MKNRRAVSLLETMVLMAVIATILTMSSALLVRELRLHSAADRFQLDEKTAWRLAADFRRAVRGAESVDIADVDAGWLVTLEHAAGSRTRFDFQPDGVTRTTEHGEEAAGAEAYNFASRPRWHVNEDRGAGLVMIRTVPPDEATAARLGVMELCIHARRILGQGASP